MKRNILVKCLLVGVVASVGALADMTVDKSNGVLAITSDISGTVIAKIIGPDDKIVVNEKYEGNSFSWTPSGMDGAYRYEVRVLPKVTNEVAGNNQMLQVITKAKKQKNDVAIGSVEISNGQLEVDRKRKDLK